MTGKWQLGGGEGADWAAKEQQAREQRAKGNAKKPKNETES